MRRCSVLHTTKILFGLIRATFFLVVGVLCGNRLCFLKPWLKLIVMRHGETIAMLLKDRAGGHRVSHISEPSRRRSFGTTCAPFGVHFCRLVCRIFSPMAHGCHSVHLGSSWGSLGFHFCSSGCLLGCILGALGMPWSQFFHFWVSHGLHFGSLGGPLGSILAKLVASGAPWGSQCPPSRPKPNFLKFCPPFWEAFWMIFGGKNR